MSSHAKAIRFGPFEVTKQVFLTTQHSFALVNIKPLLPGHVLICPLEPHQRLTDLSAPELTDLFTTTQVVQRMLARHYFTAPATPSSSLPSSQSESEPAPPDAGSFNIAIQDGADAGQTVKHVHVHLLPRIPGATGKDPGPTDRIYELMADEEGNVGGGLWDAALGKRPVAGGAFPRIEDCEREARSNEEMEEEAEVYRGVLKEMDK